MRLPAERGPLSASVLAACRGTKVDRLATFESAADRVAEPLRDADLQLALACCYELHYRGFDDVPDDMEWSPIVLARRAVLEAKFEDSLQRLVPTPAETVAAPISERLRRLVDEASAGSSVSGFLLRRASLDHFRQFLMQRSVYHLREADSHTWQIPRLSGPAKAALVEIQADEYGGGDFGRMHATLFAQSMRALGLDDSYGRYWDSALAETFATVNVMSLFGLHRRNRGASAGHLAVLEMTSTGPNRRYANGLRRLGLGPLATEFFDEHVEADAVHEQVAAVDLCGSLARQEPTLYASILWGANCCLHLDELAGASMLAGWETASAVAS